jgi:hypothetical protein
MPGPPPSPPYQARPTPRFQPGGPPGGSRYVDPMVHVNTSVPGYHQVAIQNLVHPGLHIPQNKPERSASGSYDRGMPSGPYIENMPRGPSGAYPRRPTGPMPAAPSPRLHQTQMAINHPMVNMPQGMGAFAYEQGSMPPGAMMGLPMQPGVMHPNMMHPPTIHSYSRQPSGPQGPSYGPPMGDMTNTNYSPGIPLQPTARRW